MARAAAARGGPDARERIQRSALETFAEMGFQGTSTREIARRAGVPLGLLPYYFGDKLKLWQASVDLAFDEMRARFANVVASPDMDELQRLRLLIRALVRFVAASPAFVRLIHDEGKRRGPRMRWLVDRHVKPMWGGLLPFVIRCQELGRLPKALEPVHLVYALVGAIDVIFHQAEECKRVTGIDPFDEAAIEAHTRVVEHLFLGPEDPRPPTTDGS